jgi:hypothetical protein
MRTPISVRKFTRITCAALMAFALTTLSGCGSSVKTSPTVHIATVATPDAHESTWVARGQTLTVKLPTKGGSNVGWRLSPACADSDLVTLEQRRAQVNDQGVLASVGEPAIDEFTFRATHTGRVSLEFFLDNLRAPSPKPFQRLVLDVGIAKPEVNQDLATANN